MTARPPAADDEAPTTSAPPGRRLTQLARIPVIELEQVGRRRAEAFSVMGIETVLDLLMHYPTRYEEPPARVAIAELSDGQTASVVASVRRVSSRRGRNGRLVVQAVLDDGSGALRCSFFNQPWWATRLHQQMLVVASGKVTSYRGELQMASPRLLVIEDMSNVPAGRVVPIYPESEKAGIASWLIERCVGEALSRAKEFADPLPASWRQRLRLAGRTDAFHDIHRPDSVSSTRPARARLAFDELFRLQLALVIRKRSAEAVARGIAHDTNPGERDRRLVDRFLDRLPFTPTGAQSSVIAQIAADLASPLPMHRLLQGDVGAGKTVVALAALLYGVQGGHQGALMVPTEVLAEQHFLGANALLAGLEVAADNRLGGRRPLRIELLTSRTSPGERERIVSQLHAGEVDVLVGTHALITDDVRFSSLGVVVIDEQHRFGVDQRAALRDKGARDGGEPHDPDLLVMTATPIPRTAAMTVYGDLDYSVLDELPKGRAPIETRWLRGTEGEEEAWEKIRAEVAAGHQAFVVCPLVRAGDAEDDGEDRDGSEAPRPVRAATEEAQRLAEGPLAGCRVGLLHGQLPRKEKEAAMARLRDGEIDVLVATTVIEVGIDVPGATVMVIEDADRFGIAQLHQLRGRVGRSDLPSWCYLLAEESGATSGALERLEALERTTDGFELAEVDLDLRGEGTVLGARQKGRNDLKLASLRRDRALVAQAREVAEQLVAGDPTLASQPLLADELRLFIGEEEAEYLLRS